MRAREQKGYIQIDKNRDKGERERDTQKRQTLERTEKRENTEIYFKENKKDEKREERKESEITKTGTEREEIKGTR